MISQRCWPGLPQRLRGHRGQRHLVDRGAGLGVDGTGADHRTDPGGWRMGSWEKDGILVINGGFRWDF